MCAKVFALLIPFAAASVVEQSEVCAEAASSQAPAMLQASRHVTEAQVSVVSLHSFSAGTNPSGAAAPLDETGYSAVADRCCQAEMKVFIQRQASNLGMEICDDAGLNGISPYHSCEKGPQSFATLTSNLLADSAERCTWIATTGNCAGRPADCPDFSGLQPEADCACSRSGAAAFDVAAATVSHSNLGGVGPDSGVQELRFTRAGTSTAGVAFDLVVTALDAYKVGNNRLNGIANGFGVVTIACSDDKNTPTNFKFAFMEVGTNIPVVVEEIHMAVFDLDGKDPNGVEIASSKGYKGYVTDAVPSVVASRLPDGRTKFSSSQAVDNVPNPSDPNSLTDAQRKNSIMYFYQKVSSFELTFGIERCIYARNLFFSGMSALNDRCGA